MKKALYAIALVFCLFPYTQIVPLEAYNQPYAIVFSTIAAMVAVPSMQRVFPRNDMLSFVALAVAGIVGFLISCLPQPSPQELKYLLIYVSPGIFALVACALIVEDAKLADRIIATSAIVWIATGAIQAVISPNFLTFLVGTFGDSAEGVLETGRGMLGLAPEPTHFGFHMLLMALLLVVVGGRNALALLCLATAVLVARSSSAIMALALGGVLYIAIFGRWWRLLLVAAIPLYYLVGLIVQSNLLPGDVRIVMLLRQFYLDPWYSIVSDGSANARLGGIYAGLQEIWRHGLIPQGLSWEVWLDQMGPILARNPWMVFISDGGVPSGTLIVIYQIGAIGLALMLYFHFRMLRGLKSHFEALLACTVVFVFLSQYMISTPGFGLILGAIIGRKVLLGEDGRQVRTAAPQTGASTFPRPRFA